MNSVSNVKMIVGLILVLVIAVIGVGLLSRGPEEVPDNNQDQEPEVPTQPEPEPGEPEPQPEPTISRYDMIPADATLMTPETDNYPPVLHSYLWEDPVILPGGINTAGVEDSPFVSPDGNRFYFFFTPNASVPAQEQLVDGVTGIWVSEKVNGVWTEATRVKLIENSGVALDGCPYITPEEIWFCSARLGNYRGLDFWIGTLTEDGVVDIRNAGELLNSEIAVGEMHITPDGNTIYYHSDAPGDSEEWTSGQ